MRVDQGDGCLVQGPAGPHHLFSAALIVDLALNEQQFVRDLLPDMGNPLDLKPRRRVHHKIGCEPAQIPQIPPRVADIVKALVGLQGAIQRQDLDLIRYLGREVKIR